jgi:hypothetical protein
MPPTDLPSDKSGIVTAGASKRTMDQLYKDAKKVMFSGDPSDLRYTLRS